MSNIVIDIAAEFTGNKAFKQAESSTDKLSKGVKSLAKTLGVAFSATAVIAFGKASVKAFAEDEAAATRLTKAVENLGLGFEDAKIKTFIADLEKTASVSDDVLRPAFQSLLQTTGSVAKSQELLKLALDVSAGSGVDAVQVSKDLSLAYLGQTKGLAKYNLGLTKAELQTAGFNKIQDKLNEQFSGQNAARLGTYAGQMEAVNVALGNAQETIGKALLNSFSILAGDSGIGGVTNSIDKLAESIGYAIGGVSDLLAELKKIPGLPQVDVGMIPVVGAWLEILMARGKAAAIKPKPFTTPMTISSSTDAATKETKARAAAEAAAKKRAAELLAMQKKTLKSQQDNLKLSKAKAIFDLQKIQIEAALKGKISEEERIRLKLMQAIEEENITQIEKYTKLLDEAQKKTIELTNTLIAVNAVKIQDPFAEWVSSANNSQAAIEQMSAAMMKIPSIIQANGREWSSYANLVANTSIQPNLREWSSQFSPSATNPNVMPTPNANPNVNVIVQGTVVSQQELQAAVMEAVNQSGITGNQLIFAPIGQSVSL